MFPCPFLVTRHNTIEYSLNVFIEFSEFSICKKCYSNLQPLVLETEMLPQSQQHTGNRQDLSNDLNSCFRNLLCSWDSLSLMDFPSVSENLEVLLRR